MGKSQSKKIFKIEKRIQSTHDYVVQHHASLSVERIYHIMEHLYKLLRKAEKLRKKMTCNEWRRIQTDISLIINFVLSNGNKQKIAPFGSSFGPKPTEASEPQLRYESYPNKTDSPVHIAQDQGNISLSEDYQTSNILNIKDKLIKKLNPSINEKEHMSSEISNYYTYIRRITQDTKLEKDVINKLEDIQIKLLNFANSLPALFDKGDNQDRIDAVVKQIQNELLNDIMDILKLYGEFSKMQSTDTNLNREETRVVLETLKKILSDIDGNRNSRNYITYKKDEFLGQSDKQPDIVSKTYFIEPGSSKINEKKSENKTNSTSNTTSTNQSPIKDVKKYLNYKRTHFLNEIVKTENTNILIIKDNLTPLNQDIQTKLTEVNKKSTISLEPFPIISNEKIDYGKEIQTEDNLKNRQIEPELQQETIKQSIDTISNIQCKIEDSEENNLEENHITKEENVCKIGVAKTTLKLPNEKLINLVLNIDNDVEKKNLENDKVVKKEDLLKYKFEDVEPKSIDKSGKLSTEPMSNIQDKIDRTEQNDFKKDQVVTESNNKDNVTPLNQDIQTKLTEVNKKSTISLEPFPIIPNEQIDYGKENHREGQLVAIQTEDNLKNRQIEPKLQHETVTKSIDSISIIRREKFDGVVENNNLEEEKFEKKEDLLNYRIGEVETKHIDKTDNLSAQPMLDKNGKELRIEYNSGADRNLKEPMLDKKTDDEKEYYREDQVMVMQNEDNLNNRQIEPELQDETIKKSIDSISNIPCKIEDSEENNLEENQVTKEENVSKIGVAKTALKVPDENLINLVLNIDDYVEKKNLQNDKLVNKEDLLKNKFEDVKPKPINKSGKLSTEPVSNIQDKIDSTEENDFKEEQVVAESNLYQTNARQMEIESFISGNKGNLEEDKDVMKKTIDTNLNIDVITSHPNEVQEHNNKSVSTEEKATTETSLKKQLMNDDKEEKYTKEFNEISEIFRDLRKEIENFVGRESDNKYFELDENCTRLVLRLDKLIFERDSSSHKKKVKLLKEIYKYGDILYSKTSQ